MSSQRRALAPGAYYFEDLEQGDFYAADGLVVTESHIVQFAGLSGDFFGLHMDDDFARSFGFRARVAHGLLVLALTDGLKNRAKAQIQAVASLGWRWDFKKPVFAGDRIGVTVVVQSKRLSQKGRGLVTLLLTVSKQTGEIVQSGETTLIVQQRSGKEGTEAAQR